MFYRKPTNVGRAIHLASLGKRAKAKDIAKANHEKVLEQDKQSALRFNSLPDKESYKWGIFHPNGYRAIKVFKDKEKAENICNTYYKGCVVREIIEW